MHIVFSHGKDGEPWGSKIIAMAEVARRHGLNVVSVDYRGLDDPQARVEKLLEECRTLNGSLVLVGSSLGGHVAASVDPVAVLEAMVAPECAGRRSPERP